MAQPILTGQPLSLIAGGAHIALIALFGGAAGNGDISCLANPQRSYKPLSSPWRGASAGRDFHGPTRKPVGLILTCK